MQLDTQPQSLTQKELQSKQTGQMFAVMQTLQPSVAATAAANLLHMFPAYITLRRTFLPAARPSINTAAATAADTTLEQPRSSLLDDCMHCFAHSFTVTSADNFHGNLAVPAHAE